MKFGVNWSGARELSCLEKFLKNGEVDFVEILIDNFLNVDPKDIRVLLDGTAVAFHVMNSQFLTPDACRLDYIADRLKLFADVLGPMYISDHIGLFYTYNNLPLPQMAEVDYGNVEEYCDKLSDWQKKLGMNLLIENYPS